MDEGQESEKLEKLRRVARIYYSRKDIQQVIADFSKARETVPCYSGEGFGKRPDTIEYPNEIQNLVLKGATSFHCSEELWSNPLDLSTEMSEEQMTDLREGWDLILDVDSKFLDYSKITAELLIEALHFHNIYSIGIKYSVSGDTPILIEIDDEIKLLPIKEAIELFKKGKKMRILSLDKNKKIAFSEIYDFLEHKDVLYEIYHSQSRIPVKSTKHHSVFIFDSEGEITEKKVEDTKKGDFLITFNPKSNPIASNQKEITTSFHLNKNQFSKYLFNKKIKITPELMRLIGYFLAEGHVTNIINQVGFSFNKNEKKYIKDCKKLLKKITNKNISIRHPNKGSTQILIHSKEWATFFDKFCGKKKEKHLPQFSWNLSKSLFLEMLIGYVRGDGHKTGKYHLTMKSVSKTLVKELVWLCKLNGISCSLSYERNKPHKLPQGTEFKGGFVYIIRIPKSEIISEFHRARNKFSPYPRDRTFPIKGLKEVYHQIKPKMFNYHRNEQMTLSKKCANLNRIKKVLNWFLKHYSIEPNLKSKKIISNYNSLFNSDIGVVEIKKIAKKKNEDVFDVSVKETEAFFGNYYPVLLHNSGNKGFHIGVPFSAFPSKLNNIDVKKFFPEGPRIIQGYLNEMISKHLQERIANIDIKESRFKVYDLDAAKKVMPDLILASPRHLFRAPYSLHEKTGLVSCVITEQQLKNFKPGIAKPDAVEVRQFMPKAKENEARELLVQALDWAKKTAKKEPASRKTFSVIKDVSATCYPPCIQNILKGIKQDGRKRGLFVMLNFFKSLSLSNEEIERKIQEWNKLNAKPLKQGYILSQLSWFSKHKAMLPPNCDKPHYKDIAVCSPDSLCSKVKNPVNYAVLKTRLSEQKPKKQKNFK